MKEKLQDICQKLPADYAEIRVHEGSSTRVNYSGEELEDIGERTGLGGCVRVLKEGGWGFATFNDIDAMEKFAEMAVEQAELVEGDPIELAEIDPVETTYRSNPEIDPAEVPLADKRDLCHDYNESILSGEKIRTSAVHYRDSRSTRYFANSEGSYIEQQFSFCGALIMAIAVDGDNVQRAYKSTGDLRGYGNVQDLEESCEDVKKRATDLLEAEPIEAGTYTVIADPKLCGVFVHEAFGHLSEADHVYENPRLREIMKPGRRFGKEILNIIDQGNMVGEAGFLAYDDEGVPAGRTPLIENGVLKGRLHNRETAARMDERPTGNARAISYSHPPIVRMTNTYMEAGETSFEEMIQDTEDGIYAKGMLGGQTNMEMFTFSAEEAWRIRDGEIAEKLREVVLTGNVFKTLKDIDAIGRGVKMHGGLGGCGKAGQGPLRVGDGGPHCRIQDVVIGGR
ncbi:MAG: TldD/PmbA family protein [Planctomycetes bacterium]|nr:TldD/PmbA family protein [Planctomycetota bacterium]